jgi:hypothetical protein
MAITSVKGSVTRTFYNGKGVEVTEAFTVRDKEIKKRWTCWFDTEHGLVEGQQVEVSGLHGDEVDEWTDKENNTRHTVKRTLNKAREVTGKQNTTAAAPASAQPAAPDAWATTPSYTDETPF